MTHLEVLVEERSAEPVVNAIVSDLCPKDATFGVRVFEGKQDLLTKLPQRLRGYRNDARQPRVLVLVDRDRQDCKVLKASLEHIAVAEGYVTKTAARPGASFAVCNRIAVTELESWLLGDEAAVLAAFENVKPFAKKQRYRDPDAIEHAAEAMHDLLRDHYPYRLGKVDCATRVAAHLNLGANRSGSFNQFVQGVTGLLR